MPLSVTFVLDTSGSVAGDKMPAPRRSAVDLDPRGTAREQDRVGARHLLPPRLAAHAADVGLQQVCARSWPSADAIGGTSLHDAVYAGARAQRRRRTRARCVLVFSDGLDNVSWLGAADRRARGAARRRRRLRRRRRRATRRCVASGRATGHRSQPRPEYLPGQTDFLDAIASATGGRVLKADTTDNLPKAFDEILQEFRTRYVITYSPARRRHARAGTRSSCKVKGRRADVKARARLPEVAATRQLPERISRYETSWRSTYGRIPPLR